MSVRQAGPWHVQVDLPQGDAVRGVLDPLLGEGADHDPAPEVTPHQGPPGSDSFLRFKTGKGGRKGEGEDWEEEEEEEDVAIRLSSRDPSQARAMIRCQLLDHFTDHIKIYSPLPKKLFTTPVLLHPQICTSNIV